VSCENVQHRLRFCLNHLNCVKMEDFQFYPQSDRQIKVTVNNNTFCFATIDKVFIK
jgi:hypothetical protein